MWFLPPCVSYAAAEFRSQAVYAPFNPGLWLQPYTPSPLSAAQASLTHSSHAGVAGSSGSVLQRGSCQPATPTPPPPSPAAATAATAAEELTGLWRGTYAHGVELVLLQLLQAPPGYDMWQQHQLAQPPPSDLDDCLPGRLLQALLHQPQAAAGEHLTCDMRRQHGEPWLATRQAEVVLAIM